MREQRRGLQRGLFGTRQVDATEHHHGMMLAIALESVVKLLAIVAVGVFAWLWLGGSARVEDAATTLFRNAPRSASAIAADAVTLMVIPANRLDHLVRANPALALALIRDLAAMMLSAEDRLRECEDKLAKK